MSKSLVMRDSRNCFSDAEKETAWRVLTSGLRGVDDKNHKSWVGFLRRMLGMEDGECAEVSTKIARSGPFHRRHMAIEQAVFNAQERFSQFEQFRNWGKVGCGFCDWCAGPKGGVIPVPRSIAYADLAEEEMRDFHVDLVAFFRGPHASKYLWRHLSEVSSAEMMNTILERFDE